MKYIIAPWGNPGTWKRITYKFRGEETTSFTSLRILQKIIKPDRTIIIGLDTLAERGSNYKEVKKNVKEKIVKYSSKFGLKNYDVAVAPGIGAFSAGVFNGNALDYYYYILAELSTSLLKDYSNTRTLEVHLDLTHGLNLMPVLTYRATKEILGLFSIFKSVRLTAYNADPFGTSSSLSINIIEDVIPSPKPFDRKIKQGRTLEPINLSTGERRLLANDIGCIRELDPSELSAFLGALYNGLPLALFRFYPAKDKLREIISKTLETYEKYIKVTHRNEKLDVNRRVKFNEDFETYLFAYLTASLLERLELVSSKEKEVNLTEIEKLTSNLFKFDERFKNRIENDIHALKGDIENKNIEEWKIYNEILEKPVGEPNSRHFLAHSGFERNIVEIKKDIENIHIRYREEKIKTIKKLCQRGLKT